MSPDSAHETTDERDAPPASEKAALAPVWIDRDLGWVDFNRRVLAEAQDPRTPLLERAKFLAIFTSNLDEFFMKRVAALREDPTPARLARIAAIHERLRTDLEEQAQCFTRIVTELAEHGIHLLPWGRLSAAQQQEATRRFDREVSPALTPLLLEPGQPFPLLSNLSLSVGFRLFDPRDKTWKYARIKVPPLSQWMEIHEGTAPGQRVFVRIHGVIRENAGKLYPGTELSGPTLFRLTRDAEVALSQDQEIDVRERVKAQLRQRRFEPVVRLEFAADADPSIRAGLMERFELTGADVYDMPGELDYTSLFQIASLDYPALHDRPWSPRQPRA